MAPKVPDDAAVVVIADPRAAIPPEQVEALRKYMALPLPGGKKGKLIDTTVKINRDGTFIVAGPAFKDGILILPLKASY